MVAREHPDLQGYFIPTTMRRAFWEPGEQPGTAYCTRGGAKADLMLSPILEVPGLNEPGKGKRG